LLLLPKKFGTNKLKEKEGSSERERNGEKKGGIGQKEAPRERGLTLSLATMEGKEFLGAWEWRGSKEGEKRKRK